MSPGNSNLPRTLGSTGGAPQVGRRFEREIVGPILNRKILGSSRCFSTFSSPILILRTERKNRQYRLYTRQVNINLDSYMSSAILNLDKKDPFADPDLGSELGTGPGGYVHIRVQQRNSRKTITTIQGLPDDLDLKRILKAFKKLFCCNGCIVEKENQPELGKVLQLQGDHRVECADFLVQEEICTKENIKLYGALA